MRTLLLLTLLTLLLPLAALAQPQPHSLGGFAPGPTPLPLELPYDLSAIAELLIVGENPNPGPVVLVLRVDDAQSTSYATRFELERTVLAGRFRIRTAPGAWRTPSGRFLAPARVVRVILNTGYGAAPVRIAALEAVPPLAFPTSVAALQFGPPEAPVFPGFQRVAPDDPRIVNGASPRVPVRRSGDHPLIGTGQRGVERFELPWPNGRWTVSLWVEDIGDWEYVPHPLQRRIRVNGETLSEYLHTPESWLRQVYFAGRETEDVQDPWTAFAARRGGLLSRDVTVRDGRLVVELAGNTIESTYLSALLVEPAEGGRAVLAQVQAARRERVVEAWPVVGPRRGGLPPRLTLGLLAEGEPARADWQPGAAAVPPPIIAPGTLGWVDVMLLSPAADAAPEVVLSPPSLDGRTLPAELRWGHWRYTRHNPSEGQLTLEAEQLRGEAGKLVLQAGLPRRLNILVRVPEGSPAGRYQGRVQVAALGARLELAYAVEVPPVALPPVDRPVGVYHDIPPYAHWFPELEAMTRRGMACELATLRGLGLTGLSPALATPAPGEVQAIAEDLAVARNAGFGMDVLAYTPIKRMLEYRGIDALGRTLEQVRDAFAARRLAAPVWSIADEPGNPGSTPADLANLRAVIRAAMPGARVAGQLNRPADRQLLGLFDVVLLNAGFGVEATELARWRRTGPTPWLYNMPDVEAAAGFFLWRSNAAGYLQWHARAIGADPFDPTDSGEADVQLLPLQPEPCAPVPDLDLGLLRIARGLGDLRWMLWLEAAAAQHPAARAVLMELRQEIPDNWHRGEQPVFEPVAWRSRLATLARSLSSER